MAGQLSATPRASEATAAGGELQHTVAATVQLLTAVHQHGKALNPSLAELKRQHKEPALLQQMCYGTMRWWPLLVETLRALLDKPEGKLEPKVRYLLLAGLHQLHAMNIPAHAAVQASVEACRDMQCDWACGLVNAILRKYLRQKPQLEQRLRHNSVWLHSHPDWLLQLLRQQWPDHWQQVTAAGNSPPPMHLRVNSRRADRDSWLRLAHAKGLEAQPIPFCPQGVHLLSPIAVELIPGFDEGMVSVQDGAAQQVPSILPVSYDDTVLDACSAPGGKVAHLLERHDFKAKPVCVERNDKRIPQLRQTLRRLGLEERAEICRGDATKPQQWQQQRLFTKMVVDAPCSATGVIRRNPDIKLRPDSEFLNSLCVLQQGILQSLWPLLAPGGKLLYITCSILEQENDAQADAFLRSRQDAENCTPQVEWARAGKHGVQVLPGDNDMDGFYYACIQKNPS